MPKQAHISISGVAYSAQELTEFEKLKDGYVGKTPMGQKYEIVKGGIPADAELKYVIYVYEHESLPDVPDPLAIPSVTVKSRRLG